MVKQDHSPSSHQEHQQAAATPQRPHLEKITGNSQRQRKQEFLQKTRFEDVNKDQEQDLSQDFDRNEGQGHGQKS